MKKCVLCKFENTGLSTTAKWIFIGCETAVCYTVVISMWAMLKGTFSPVLMSALNLFKNVLSTYI